MRLIECQYPEHSLKFSPIAPLIHYRAKMIVEELTGSPSEPTPGIYYVIRLPKAWTLFPAGFDVFPDMEHKDLWRDYVSKVVGTEWANHLGLDKNKLIKQLLPHYTGFPRGRVLNPKGTGFKIWWGNNMKEDMPTKSDIRRAFGLTNEVPFVSIGHEFCLASSKDAVRSALNLVEDWPVGNA